MRWSSEHVQDVVDRGIDLAQDHAATTLIDGAKRIAQVVDHNAERLTDVVDRGFDHAPSAELVVRAPGRSRRPWRWLLVVGVGIAVVAVGRRLLQGRPGSSGPAGTATSDPAATAETTLDVVARPGNDGWDVVGPDGDPVSKPASTQADGIVVATELVAEAGGGEVVVHGLDGKPRETRTVAAATH